MRRTLPTLIIISIALLTGYWAKAQCTIGTGAATNYGIVFPDCGTFNTTPTNFGPGQFAEMPMLIGGSYTISTCGNGTFQGYDTQITVRQTNNNLLGYDDDALSGECGTMTLNSYLDLAGTVNEYVRVGVKRYNCQPNSGGSTSIFVRFRQNNNLDWGSTVSQACEGETVPLVATPAPNPTSLGSADKGTYSGMGVFGTDWTAPSVSSNTDYTITYTFGACQITRTMTSLAYPNAIGSITGDDTPCTGVPTIYTASVSGNASSYEWVLPSGWTGTSTTNSISVTPSTNSGTIQVRGVNACGEGPWVSLPVNPVNVVLTTTNNTSAICSGEVTDIELASSIGGSTYSWTATGSGSISGFSDGSGFNGSTIIQTLTNNGTTQGSVTYVIYASAQGCDSPTDIVTVFVDPLPAASLSGNATICEGSSTDLTVNLTVGTPPFSMTYTDGNSTLTISGLTNGDVISVNPTVTSTYAITSVTDANGCTSTTGFGSPVTITVDEAPNGSMSVVSPICFGEQTTLTFNFTAGTGPYDVQVSDGITTFTETGISSGHSVNFVPITTLTYNFVSITDANGCVRTSGFAGSAQVIVTPLPIVSFSGLDAAYCISSAPVTLTGNQAPDGTFTGQGITDLGNGTATFDQSTAGAGTHTISYTYTDINGCTDTYTQDVDVDLQPDVDAGSGGDECDLSFTFSANPSVGNGTWSMVSGPGTAFFNDVNDPTSSVQVDTYGTYVFGWGEVNGECSGAAQVTVNFYEQPVADAGLDGEECDLDFIFAANPSIGTGTWTQTGGPGTAAFVDANDPTTTVTVTDPGIYTFQWEEVEGICSDADDVSVLFDPSVMADSISASTTSLCAGETATLTVNGGHLGLDAQWVWYSGSCQGTAVGTGSTIVVSPQTSTTYYVHAIGSCDTTMCVSVLIDASDPPVPGFSTVQNPSDCGLADGSITAIAAGGMPPYTFQWSNGATGATITGLAAGPYTVTVTDANGCVGVGSATLNDPGASVVFLTDSDADDIICEGESVTFTATGAFLYQFFIDGVPVGTQNPFTTNALQDGQTVHVTGTDLNLCSYTTAGIQFTVNDAPEINEVITEPSVCGASDGSIALNISGGTPNYNVLWGGGQTTETLTGLAAGPYFVTVADQGGCSTNGTFGLNDPGAAPVTMTSSEDPTNEICEGESITFTASGSMNYEFYVDGQSASTSNPFTTSTLVDGQSVLATGTDINNCAAVSNIIYPTVNPGPTILLASDAQGDSICVGQTITFFASGGMMYEFFVDGTSQGPASATSTFSSSTLTTGQVIDVLGTDVNGCEVMSNAITVTVSPGPSVTITGVSDPSFCGATDGEMTAIASGGTPTYTYSWSNGGSTSTISGLAAGNYVVNVVDALGCSASASESLSDVGSTPVNMTTDVGTDTICGGTTVTFTADNGFDSYVFYVNGIAASTQNPYITDDLDNGDVVAVTATDTANCTSTSDPITFTVYPELLVSVSSFLNPSDCGFTDGEATALVVGGLPPYNYLWSNGQTTATATGLAAGPYIVTVTDANGCIGADAVSLSDPGSLAVGITANPPDLEICEGTEIEFTGSGANSYEFFVDGVSVGTTNPFITNTLMDGQTVAVVGTDINNCTATSPGLTYQVNSVVTATLALGTTEVCSDQDTIVLTGGLPLGGEYTVNYFGNVVTSDLFFPGLAGPGVIDVEYTYTTFAGCSSNVTGQITVYETPVADAGVGGGECDLDFDLLATPSVGTGTWTQVSGPGTSTFSSPNGFATTVTVTVAGTYEFQWEEVEGVCSDADTVTVDFWELPVVTFSGLDAAYCADDTNPYTLTGSPAGGVFTGPGLNGNIFTPSSAGVGSHIITYAYVDINGCANFEAQTVTINPLPVVSFSGLDAGYCQDASAATLTGSPAGGTFSGPGISGSDFDPATAGVGVHNITYTYSDVNGCEDSETQTVEVYAAPSPTITPSGSVEICDGDALDLNAGTGYIAYDWNGLGSDQFLEVTTGGSYTVTVTSADGCTGTSAATTVTVNPLPVVDLGPDTTICVGGSLDLDAENTGSTFAWSTFENTQIITVSTTNNYSVTVTDANNCSSSDDITVQVQGDIEPVISSVGPDAACLGDSVVMEVGPNTYTSYDWSDGGMDPTNTVGDEGFYQVTVTDENGCSGTSFPFYVGIYQLPNAVVVADGATDLCAGDTLTLSASAQFSDYTWFPNGELTNSISVTQDGSFAVTVIDPVNGCEATSDTIDIAFHEPVPPNPTADGPLEFCIGGDVVLDAGPGYGSYLWNSGSTTQSITVTASGSYSVTVMDIYGCIDSSNVADPFDITVWDPQVNSIQIGDSMVSSGGPFASYQWFLNGAPIPGAIDSLYAPSESGNYHVQITDENGCIAGSDEMWFSFVGIAGVDDPYRLMIYPNPNKGRFTLSGEFENNTALTVRILDAVRKEVLNRSINNTSRMNEEFSIEELPNGVYHLQINTDKGTITRRIMKI